MNSRYLLGLAGVLIVAALAFVFVRSSDDEEEEASASRSRAAAVPSTALMSANRTPRMVASFSAAKSSSRDIEALTAQLQQVQRELDALRRQRDSNSVSEPSDTTLTLAEQEAQERARTAQTTALLDNSFAAQPKDPTWSLQAERQVADSFNSDEIAAGSQLQQLSCQSTLCRIQSHHSDTAAERVFMTRLGRLNAFGDAEAYSQRLEQPDGSIETVTFVTRSGHRLPSME